MIVDHPHQLVDQESLRRGAFGPARGAFGEAPRDLGPALVQRVAQQRDDLRAGLVRADRRDQIGDGGGGLGIPGQEIFRKGVPRFLAGPRRGGPAVEDS